MSTSEEIGRFNIAAGLRCMVGIRFGDVAIAMGLCLVKRAVKETKGLFDIWLLMKTENACLHLEGVT